jgi:hypothetical protein
MRRLLENESSKLELLSLNHSRNFFAEALPNKLPSSLKSFSLCNKFYCDSSNLILLSIIARDCKNLQVLHLEIRTLCSEISMAIGNIKRFKMEINYKINNDYYFSLVYLNLIISIKNETALKHVICHELPNLKAFNIGNCTEVISKWMVFNFAKKKLKIAKKNHNGLSFCPRPKPIPNRKISTRCVDLYIFFHGLIKNSGFKPLKPFCEVLVQTN